MKDFHKFTRNPLGIIGLFIVLIYGIAGWTTNAASTVLSKHQLSLLLIFLVVFPFVILFVFYQLVTKHTSRLYEPRQYPNNETLHNAYGLSRSEQKAKIDAEVEVIGQSGTSAEMAPKDNEYGKVNKSKSAKKKTFISSDSLSVEVEKNIRDSIILSERLVVSDLECTFGVQVLAQQRYKGIPFDAIYDLGNKVMGVEIKYVPKNQFNVGGILKHLQKMKGQIGKKNIDLMLVLVSEDLSDPRFGAGLKELQQQMEIQDIAAHVRVRDFSDLAKDISCV